MGVRKFCANYVYTGIGKPLKNGIVEIDGAGTVLNIIDTGGQMAELSNMEFHSGVIVPGFVNAHCHLELSHLRGKIEQGTGLPGFIAQIGKQRGAYKHIIERNMLAADAEMYQQGIVAVGDISNNTSSIKTKQKSKLFYHSFVEVFGLDSTKATAIFDSSWHTKLAFTEKQLSCSITPHAPYSISEKLFRQLREYIENSKSPVSFHNQETASENELFEHGSGELFDAFQAAGFPVREISVTGQRSLRSNLRHFPQKNNLLLVHNTFTNEADVIFAEKERENIFWTLCPNANLYIEDKLPNIEMLRQHNVKIALGTDSLASNDQLSILEEMITINEYFPWIPFEELLGWGCINGAKALNIYDRFGSIEKGKQPGLVLIQGFDYEQMQINDECFARRIA